jgi:hypothetical protein
MAGQDVDAYLKEMEQVHRQTQAEKAAELQSRMDALQPKSHQGTQEGPPRRFPGMPPGPPPGPPPSFGVTTIVLFTYCHHESRVGGNQPI